MTELPVILDREIKEIFIRLAGFEVHDAGVQNISAGGRWSVFIYTYGDYDLNFVLDADDKVMHEIARHMKHGELENDEDIYIYIPEFFNVLCGRIVSSINRQEHLKARFGIPQISKNHGAAGTDLNMRQQYCYDSIYGMVKMEVQHRASDDALPDKPGCKAI